MIAAGNPVSAQGHASENALRKAVQNATDLTVPLVHVDPTLPKVHPRATSPKAANSSAAFPAASARNSFKSGDDVTQVPPTRVG